MITGKYDRQLDRSNRSKNIHDLALGTYSARCYSLGDERNCVYCFKYSTSEAKLNSGAA